MKKVDGHRPIYLDEPILIFGAISTDPLAPGNAGNRSSASMRAACGAALPFEEALFCWLHRVCVFAGDQSIVKSVRSI